MTWLTDHLVQAGHVTEAGTTRRARIKSCPKRCKASVLTGLTDAKVCAVEAHVDPVPLNELGEALALLEGRDTVVVRREGGRFVIDQRDYRAIKVRPAGTVDGEDVMRRHRCHTPAPVEAMTAPSTFRPRAQPLPLSSDIPF